MNVTFTTRQRNVVTQGFVIFAAAIVFVTIASAAGAMPSTFTVQAETLMAMAQGAFAA